MEKVYTPQDSYITLFNSKSIIANLDLNTIDVNEEIYKIDKKFFSEYEIRTILSYKYLFKDPETFFTAYKKRNKANNESFIYKNSTPCYHL